MTLLRLAGFQAALAYTLLMLVAMSLVLGLLYARLADNLRRAQDNIIWREAAVLSLTYQRDGLRGLAQTVALAEAGQGRYVRLSDTLGAYLAGNLKTFPTDNQTDADGWINFRHGNASIRARLIPMDTDVILLVGQDVSDGDNLLASFRRAFLLALLAMLCVGLGGGVFLARRGLKQVEAIGAALKPIMQGDLSARVPARQDGAEWQALKAQINTMLAQLENLMQATRQVSDNLAHDLRAPLTRLRARLEALLAADESAELEAALQDVDALLRSFNALLALSRLESGVAKLIASPVDVSALLTDMHELFEPLFEEKGMVLTLNKPSGLSVKGDASLLGQALVNGLENVLTHACVAGSEVVLAAEEKEARLILSIADGGAGIAADKREDAVRRFVQLDESRSAGGSGLGLSLMAAICAHHKGHIELHDNQPGLKVEMHLPVKAK